MRGDPVRFKSRLGTRLSILLTALLFAWPGTVEAVTGEASLKLPGMNAIPLDLSIDISNYTLRGESENVREIGSSAGEISRIVTRLTLSGRWDPDTRLFTGTVSGEKLVTNLDQRGEEYGSSRVVFSGKVSGETRSALSMGGTADITYTHSSATGTVGQPPAAGTFEAGEFFMSTKGGKVADGVLVFPFAPFYANVVDVSGDVEISRDGGETWQALDGNGTLRVGDYISTGYESGARLWFYDAVTYTPVGKLDIPSLTQLRVDNYLRTKEGREKTQLNLRIGAVKATIKYVPGIRADFTVGTPTANAGIRGSEMVVIADESGATTIYAIEDTTYVTPATGEEERSLQEGFKVEFAADGSAGEPVAFSVDELSAVISRFAPASGSETGGKRFGSVGTLMALLAVVVLAGLITARARGRKQAG